MTRSNRSTLHPRPHAQRHEPHLREHGVWHGRHCCGCAVQHHNTGPGCADTEELHVAAGVVAGAFDIDDYRTAGLVGGVQDFC
jgi:hypothetical protein